MKIVIYLIVILTFLSIFRRRMKNLKKWSAFHKQLTDWALEIQDKKVRDEFLAECIQNLINHDAQNIEYNVEKEKIFNKWGSHIASLRQEIRHKRLKKLV